MDDSSNEPSSGRSSGVRTFDDWTRQPTLKLRLALLLCEEVSWLYKLRAGPLLESWEEVHDDQLANALRVSERAAIEMRHAIDAARPLAELELERAVEADVSLLTPAHPAFPTRLFDLSEPPFLLYLRAPGVGTFSEPFEAATIAMVGPRNADPHALEDAARFARDFASAGITVVSGFARGVDIACHRAAAELGTTVAVLGTGLLVAYPNHHQEAQRIVELGGAVLTEFPLHCEPQRWHFPLRNRLIAALGDATLVVQASRRSGSLLTAHAALELGRDVWALPGRLCDARSRGANLLLRDGAGLALEPRDVIETLPAPATQVGCLEATAAAKTSAGESVAAAQQREADLPLSDTHLSKEGKALVQALGRRAASVERLAKRADLEIAQVLAALGELELEGRIERRGVDLFRLAR